MDVDAQKPSSKKAAPSSKPRAKRAGTAGAAADAAVAAKATKKAKASSSSPPAAPGAGVGSGRAAAQNVKYDFDVGAGSFSRRGDVVEVKAAREAEDEAAAVELLGGAQAAADGRFRLLDLAVFEDGTGELVPLDRVGLAGSRPLFASAVVTRAEGAPRSAGVAVARLGPLSGFGVDGIPSSADSDSSPVALTLTSTASGLTYVVSRASPAYRKLLAHVQEEAELAAETARVLVAAVRPSGPIIRIYIHEMTRMEAEPKGAAETAPIGRRCGWRAARVVAEATGATGWEGRKGARWAATPIGPMPGPPPPCGMQNVLWRLRWQTSAPMKPGEVSPTCAFILAPSIYTWPPC